MLIKLFVQVNSSAPYELNMQMLAAFLLLELNE